MLMKFGLEKVNMAVICLPLAGKDQLATLDTESDLIQRVVDSVTVGVPGASFDRVTCRNLEIASDLAIQQVLLTRSKEEIRSSRGFRLEMYDLLRTFPRSRAFLGAV